MWKQGLGWPESRMAFPAHLIWLLRGTEASADDGLCVSPRVESLIEMRVNFSRIYFFRSPKNEIRNTKYLCPYSNPKLIKILQSSSDPLDLDSSCLVWMGNCSLGSFPYLFSFLIFLFVFRLYPRPQRSLPCFPIQTAEWSFHQGWWLS